MTLRAVVHAAVLAAMAGCAAVPAGDARSARRDGPSTIVVHLRGLRPVDGAGPVAIAVWGFLPNPARGDVTLVGGVMPAACAAGVPMMAASATVATAGTRNRMRM